MPLPGKLCVGILEEDNPQKSYFRFKPLLVMDGGAYAAFPGGDAYPEDGCLRIVPDKNESSRFKARMRRIGRYALLDLRAHPGENDKIRPNKNYMVDPQERNAHIVYSDVVVEPADGMLFEILDHPAPPDAAHMALTMPLPGTRRVLLRQNGGIDPALWRAEKLEDVEGAVSLERDDACAELARGSEMRMRGFRDEELQFLLAAPGEALIGERAAEAAEKEPAPEPAPEPKPEEEPRAVPAFGHNVPRIAPRPAPPAMQTGLNPPRGRSLQEIIDDRWRRSRIDQLGHPVPSGAMGTPVESPIERAASALKQVWRTEELRTAMVEALSSLDGFAEALGHSAARRSDEGAARQLNDMEAQRLRLLDELSALNARRADARAELLNEVRREHAREIKEREERLGALASEIELLQLRAEDARAAADEAERSFEDIERRLFLRAMEGRAAKFLRAGAAPARPRLTEPSAGELISDVRTYFASSGMPISHDGAVNLLACFALSPATILCGTPFAAKDELARTLAGALGLDAAGRFLVVSPAGLCPQADQRLENLIADRAASAPGILLIGDCNAPGKQAHAHALIARLEGEFGGGGPLRMLLTAQDAGNPLPAGLVDRAFVLRLSQERADSRWAGEISARREPDGAVSLHALRRIFSPSADAVSADVLARMEKLRGALSEYGVLLSRRTLDATWAYCAAATPKFCEVGPMGALDLALSQRAMPSILSRAPIDALRALPDILDGLDACRQMLSEPMPLELG